MIARRRIGEEYFDDFLQTVVDRDSYPEDEKLDDQEIIDNLITLILAGQTTTASAMMWCVKFLSENKDALDKLRVRLFIHCVNMLRIYKQKST